MADGRCDRAPLLPRPLADPLFLDADMLAAETRPRRFAVSKKF